MKIHDTLNALGIAAFGGWVLWYIQRFPPMPGQKFGPAVYPGVIACGLLICAAVLSKSSFIATARLHARSRKVAES